LLCRPEERPYNNKEPREIRDIRLKILIEQPENAVQSQDTYWKIKGNINEESEDHKTSLWELEGKTKSRSKERTMSGGQELVHEAPSRWVYIRIV